MGLFDFLLRKKDVIQNNNDDEKIIKLRKDKRYKEISIERKKELENYVKEIAQKTEISAYVPVESGKKNNIFSSKFGGTPYWDFKEKFPTDSNGNNLFLLAQINFDTEKFEGGEFPNEGMLQFFIGTDDLMGLDFDNPDKQLNWRIVYHPTINYEVKEKDVLKLDLPELDLIDETSSLSFEKSIDIIGNRVYNYYDIVGSVIPEQLSDIESEYKNEVAQVINNSPSDKLLGYPLFWQDDPRERENFKKYNTLLFQYSTCTDVVFFFFINNEDLKRKDFSKVLYWFDN